MQSRRFLSRLLGSLLKTGLPLIKNVITPLAKKDFTTVRINSSIISNRWGYSKNIMKIVKSLENSCLLIKGAGKTIENEVKEQTLWIFLACY